MGPRSRTLKYLAGHPLRFGIAAVARDEVTGDVVEAVCLFCKHFGREQRAGKKRKSASTVKYFRDSFRPDQYTQHHQLQHPTLWKRYKSCTDEEKRAFFPLPNAQVSVTTPDTSTPISLIPTEEVRGRQFDLKAEIVEIVAVLAVGFGPVESTVKTRDRLMYQYMTHHNYDEQPSTYRPRWSPPPNTFQSCSLVQNQPPIYRVVVYSRSQLDFVMEMAAEGLSGAQISTSVKVFRDRAMLLLGDLVENDKNIGRSTKQSVSMTVEGVKERTREKFQGVEHVSPEYNEGQTAEIVRLGVAVSLSVIARLLEESWAFALMFCTVDRHSMYAYLDVRVKFYNRIGGLRSAHLMAIPNYVGKCDTMMFKTLDRVLTSLLPVWRKKVLGVTTDGDVSIPTNVVNLVKHFQNAASGSALYRTSNCINQLQRILNTFYVSLDNGSFLSTLKTLSEYIRKAPSVLAEMKRFPGYWDQLKCDAHSHTSAPVAFGQEIDMLVVYSAFLQGHFKEVELSSEEFSLMMPPPPVSWWLTLEILHWVTARANAVFGVLENQHLMIPQQAAVASSLAEECITGMHAKVHVDGSLAPQTRSETGSAEFVSDDGHITLSKSGVVDFVMESSTLARELVQHGGTATVYAVAEHFAVSAVNNIASLVELRNSLQQQFIACTTNSSSAHTNRAIIVTDELPPVLPLELAQLSSNEFAEVLQAHDATLQGAIGDVDIEAIREEHELLCRTFAEDEGLRCALEMYKQGTQFDVAWGLIDTRFKCLEAFAGGLATVCPSQAIAVSDCSANDLVVCPKDMEEARLLLADFELESALHAQQFQSLTKLQEEIYDREPDTTNPKAAKVVCNSKLAKQQGPMDTTTST